MSTSDTEAWITAERIFGELLKLPAEARTARLHSMPLADDVREHVKRMLAALDRPGGPLDRPPPAPPTASLSGRTLGRWRLLEELGRGGMAVVYRAESTTGPEGQQAAVKVLTLGALASSGGSHVLREQQVLLRLRHPYIAPLLDAGVDDDGTPWLAMALVEGERLDAWCETRRTGIEGRIRLVLQVGEALAYAHRNLVIHRDVKPSNVLVDADGHARLLDFGIARLANEADAERTLTALRALTPEYAAPEQFAGAPPSTAMDVYGLGALLYRLLAGRPPRDKGDDGHTETLAPSRAARQAPAMNDTTRRQRARLLRGDLDAILLKALARNPEQRYAGIEALCDDLRHWLARRPVRARPPSRGYLLARFVARNRVGVAAAAVVLAVATVGLAGTLWQAREASHQAQQALAEAQRAQAARDFMVQLFEANDPDIAQGQMLSARDLLDQGARSIHDSFADNPTLRADMLVLLSGLHRHIGEHETARLLLSEGLRLAESGGGTLYVDALLELGALEADLGRHHEALAALERAERELSASGQIPGKRHGAMMRQLPPTLRELGRQREALARAESAMAQVRDRPELPASIRFDYLMALGRSLIHNEQLDRAEVLLLEAIALDFSGADAPSRRIAAYSLLAGIYDHRGQTRDALAFERQAMALADRIYPPTHPRRAGILGNLGWLLSETGEFDEAVDALRESLSIMQAHYQEDNISIAAVHSSIGTVLVYAGRPEEAVHYLTQATEMVAKLIGRDHPDYATVALNLSNALQQLGRFEEAISLVHQALAARQAAFGPDHHLIGATHVFLVGPHLALDRPAEALQHAEAALAIYRRADWDSPRDALVAQILRARALQAGGNRAQTEAAYKAAIAFAESHASDVGHRWPQALEHYAGFLAESGSPGASAAIARALEVHREYYGEDHPATLRTRALAESIDN